MRKRHRGTPLRAGVGVIATVVLVRAPAGAATGGARAPARDSPASPLQADTAVMTFVDSLRAAVGRDDRQSVAALVAYPARVWDGRRSQHVRSAAAFVRLYPGVVTPDLRRDLAAVTPDSLFSNWQGVMFAAGRVWLRRTGRDGAGPYRVVTINRPVAGR